MSDEEVFKGKTFVIVGRLESMTRDEAWLKIVQLGGYTSKTPRPSSDVFVMGTSSSAAREAKARALNKKMLTEQEFLDAVARAEAAREDAREELPVGDAIGELRALFDGAPTREVWHHVCAVLDTCPPERLDDLVSYVEAQIARWPSGLGAGRAPVPALWLGTLGAAGELRIAPYTWQKALLDGESSPKFGLLRALSMAGYPPVNGTIAAKIAANPSLTGLRFLDVGRGNDKLTQTFYRKLFTSARLERLEGLAIRKLDAKIARVITAQPTTLTALRVIELAHPEGYWSREQLDEMYGALFEAPWWPQIQGLTLGMAVGYGSYEANEVIFGLIGARPDTFAGLRGLSLTDANHMHALRTSGLCAQLTHVGLYMSGLRELDRLALIGALCDSASNVRDLDLWCMYDTHGGTSRDVATGQLGFIGALVEAGLPPQLKTLHVRQGFSQLTSLDAMRAREALGDAGVAVVEHERGA